MVGVGVHFDEIGTRMTLWTGFDQLAKLLRVEVVGGLGEGKATGEELRNSNLIDVQVGVGCDDGAAGVVHSFSHHVHPEKALKILKLICSAIYELSSFSLTKPQIK